jgi:PAS domain S-box-containing protein
MSSNDLLGLRKEEYFASQQESIYRHTDFLFAPLLLLQWFAAVATAIWISPRAWVGTTSEIHPHVWAAIFLGGVICSFPLLLIWKWPGHALTRHTVAIAQMCTSLLLIHLTGGRIETHFHVFGSLAFLAFYRDWRVLVTGSLVVVADHLLRGTFWPESVFGVHAPDLVRALEHSGWVVFEDIFLFLSIRQSLREMHKVAGQQAELKALNTEMESKVVLRTAELSASEEKFRQLSAAAPIGIYQTDSSGRCVYVNSCWIEISALSVEQSLGDGWREALHLDDRKSVWQEWQIAARSGRDFERECRVLTPTQESRWVHIRAKAMRATPNQFIGHVGTMEDITERKRAEEVLRQSEERFRLLVEGVQDYAIFMLSPQGHVVSWNKGAERIKGYKLDEIIGKYFSCFYPPEAIAQGKPEQDLRTAMEQGHMNDEGWRVRKDGQQYRANVVISAIFDKDGCLRGFAIITRDLTERERIERALYDKNIELAEARTEQAEARTWRVQAQSEQAIRASELRYRRLFEAAKEGILILDADTGRISDVNPFLVELLGFSLSEMLGKTVGELSPFKDMESNKNMLEQLQRHGYVRYEDLPLETTDHRHIAVEFVSNVYQAGDKKVIQCNVRDVTERKHAEDEIRGLNAELEQRVAERTAQLEAFSYSVSHDLRAPLRHVVGFVELLQRDAGQSLSEKGLRYIKTISQSAKRMGNLIDDLLAFSHIGESEMQKTEVNLDELVLDTLGDFQVEIKERIIEWNIHPLPAVRADRALLRLVLVNLISNAVKFTSVRAEARIEIGCVPAGSGETVIFIRDNGAGFDPKYTEKLFGVFQRLHRQDEFEGTGIGLANIHRIIRRHGGRAWAEGLVDAGATFYFSIPTRNGSINGQ